MLAFFDDAGFVIGGYVLTFAVTGIYAWRVVRSGRKLAENVPDDEKYWT